MGNGITKSRLGDTYDAATKAERAHDPVNHPSHYTSHPSGVECIEITEHMTFNAGNAVKYLWRNGLKDQAPALQELEKAKWYVEREIERIKALQDSTSKIERDGRDPTADVLKQGVVKSTSEFTGSNFDVSKTGDLSHGRDTTSFVDDAFVHTTSIKPGA